MRKHFRMAYRSLALIKKFGEIDAKILWHLLRDGRKDFVEIAKECGISKSVVWNRYNSMKKAGIIVGSTVMVNYKHFGFNVLVAIVITIEWNKANQIIERLQKISNVIVAYPLPMKREVTVILKLHSIEELSALKRLIELESSAKDTRTYIWTGIRNIPENISLGIPAKTIEAWKTKLQPTTVSKHAKRKIDETDLQIIDQLRINGRKSFRKIAQEIGVTPDTVARRYSKLKKNGTIRTVVQINPMEIGYYADLECRLAFMSEKDALMAVETFAKFPDIILLVTTSGGYNLILWMLIRDIKHLIMFQEEIAEMPRVSRIEIQVSRRFARRYPNNYQNLSTI
jgi:DNA-binding Lrp family transcriptional regulator